MEHGTLVISLDFELYWGVHDVMELSGYRDNLLGVRQAIPRMLALFESYHIHATWAAVGFLFYQEKEQMLAHLPERKPGYTDMALSPYPKLPAVGKDELEDPLHFGGALIDQIKAVPHQEIGTHTFSHYYCLEAGQTEEEFEDDLKAALAAAERHGAGLKSIVFPRNQVNHAYLDICRKHGLATYRGNEQSFVYHADAFSSNQSPFKRIIRLLDAYLNLTGHHIHVVEGKDSLVNVPASKFLRPYSKRLKWAEPMKLGRIKKSMTKAAKENKMYHLWWHPHNFGTHIEENGRMLTEILEHYRELEAEYGMKSLNMGEVGALAGAGQNNRDIVST